MANRTFQGVQCLNRGIKIIQGRINLSAAAAVSSVVGKGFTVVKTGTGTYDILLGTSTSKPDRYNTLLGCGMTKLEAAAGALMPMIISEQVSNATSPKVTIKTAPTATGTPTDTAAAISIFFDLHLQNHSGS